MPQDPIDNSRQQSEQDGYRDRQEPARRPIDAGAGAFGRSTSRRLHKQGDQRASKRAQTALRDIAVRRWDSAMLHKLYHGVK